MNKIFSLFLCLIGALILSSCQGHYIEGAYVIAYQDDVPLLINAAGDEYSLSKYDEIIPVFGDIITVGKLHQDKMQYGYIMNNGEVLIKPQYDFANLMRENKAVITDGNQQRIINTKGTTLYTFPNSMSSYHYYQDGYLVVEIDNQYSFLNDEFELRVERYDYASHYQDGYAIVGQIDDHGRMEYFLIDHDAKMIGNAKYDFVDYFYEGYARVANGTFSDGRLQANSLVYKYMNEDGQFLKDEVNDIIAYDYARNFHDGLTIVANYLIPKDHNFLYKSYRILQIDGTYPYDSEWKTFLQGTGIYFLSLGDIIDGSLVMNGLIDINGNFIARRFTNDLNKTYIIDIDLTNIDGTKDNMYTYPHNIENFKRTPYYQAEPTAFAKVQLSNKLYGLVDVHGVFILKANYTFLFY